MRLRFPHFLSTTLLALTLTVANWHVAAGTPAWSEQREWWNGLSTTRKAHLASLFDSEWYYRQDRRTRIAYAYAAESLYDFLDSGADSNADDSYVGFAPLMLRASFHGAGTFNKATGTGGSNGGTIFNHAELADEANGCIETATSELVELFHGDNGVPLADVIVIAGIVALDVMEFPRMDLVAMSGGRDMVQNIANVNRLPSADDDPLEKFRDEYDLTESESVALAGGPHNFGAAHGKCSGYQGQWTASPLSWFGGPNADEDPSFFPDLLRDDWRWYEVCTFENDQVSYLSIPDPFANGLPEEEEEEEGGDADACEVLNSIEPILCEEQAMRGCDFADGMYGTDEFPCDVNLLQMRLRSDFFLKANPVTLPFAEQFAANPALLAEEFGIAYHKVTHNGLDRCGLSGHGCPRGHICQRIGGTLTDTCVLKLLVDKRSDGDCSD